MRNKIAKSISNRSDRKQYKQSGSTAYAPLQEPKFKMSKRQQRLAKNKDRFTRGIALLKIIIRNSTEHKATYYKSRLDSWIKIQKHENTRRVA